MMALLVTPPVCEPEPDPKRSPSRLPPDPAEVLACPVEAPVANKDGCAVVACPVPLDLAPSNPSTN